MNAAAQMHRHRHEAMATTFELRLVCDDADYSARAAGECFARIDRLEALLNRYDENSEIARLSFLGAGETLRLASDTFACLRLALELNDLTGGAFDPTLGARLDARRGRGPFAGQNLSRGRLELQPATFEARVIEAPVTLDLGAIGKGFALDRLADTLLEWDLPRALLIAGEGSSVLALDGPAPGLAWEIGLSEDESRVVVPLLRQGLGASGFAVQGEHILDPLSDAPVAGRRAWALAPNAAVADAVSTAAMLLTPDELAELCAGTAGLGVAIAAPGHAAPLTRFGALARPPVFPAQPASS
jgi:thiamine biosynthesis lipoprotein